MSLSYSLQADDSFMQSLPWFSQAQGSDGPEFDAKYHVGIRV